MLNNAKPNERFADGDAYDVRILHSPYKAGANVLFEIANRTKMSTSSTKNAEMDRREC